MTTRESSSLGFGVRALRRTIYYGLDHRDHCEVSQGGSLGITVRDPGVLPLQTAWPVRPSWVAVPACCGLAVTYRRQLIDYVAVGRRFRYSSCDRAVLSVVYMPRRSASIDWWSGEVKKSVQIH